MSSNLTGGSNTNQMYFAKVLCLLNFESCSTYSMDGFILIRSSRDVHVEFWDAREQPAIFIVVK